MNWSGTAMQFCNGTSWADIGGAALSGLTTDVTISSPANNDILQYSSGTSKWVNTALVSAVAGAAGPSFYVTKGGTNQTVAANSYVKVTWPTEVYDTNNNFASDRFTPTVAGKYIISAQVWCTDSAGYCMTSIYKNGSAATIQFQTASGVNNAQPTSTIILDMNGSTDYVEVYGYNSAGTTFGGVTTNTFFSGGLLAPLASGTVAGTGSAGYVPVWTSGNAITYDSTASQMLMWDLANHRLGIGTTTPSTLLHVAGNSTFGGTTAHTGAATFSSTITGATGVGIGTSSVNSKAVLDLVSTTLGFLPPRMTTTQRDAISSPMTGLIVYNTTTNALNVYNGSAWGAVGGGGALSSLSDVSISSPATGHVLQYNGSAWANVAAQTAMGTSTMVAGWPDAIACNFTNPAWGNVILFPSHAPYVANGYFYYRWVAGNGTVYGITFNGSGGFIGYETLVSSNCDNKTIAQLYAAGQAFNFIGTGAVTTFNVGTASAPGLAVTSDTDTGLWSAGSNTLNFATGGVERVVIDSSGRVGIGTTSPNDPLEVYKSQAASTVIRVNNPSSSGNTGIWLYEGGTSKFFLGSIGSANSGPVGGTNAISFWNFANGPIVIAANNAEAMRITAAGNVGIGTASPAAKLDLQATGDDDSPVIRMRQSNSPTYGVDLGIDNNVNGGLVFRTVNAGTSAVAMTLDRSNGYLGIGASSPAARLTVIGTDGTTGFRVYAANGGHYATMYSDNPGNIYFQSDSTYCVLAASSTSFSCPSDARLKENVLALPEEKGLAAIERLRPVAFKRIGDEKHSTQLGFIAQEVQKVIPELVTRSQPMKLTPDGTFTLNTDGLIPVLTKGVQELKALLDGNRAELMKLKAANDNQAAALMALETEFRAYKAAHP